jgi:hypothetical protein
LHPKNRAIQSRMRPKERYLKIGVAILWGCAG